MPETPIEAIERKLLERIDILASISSDFDGITRIFLSKEMDTAAKLIKLWMNNAGLVANVDPLQNVIGSWPSENAKAPAIHLGSHYDTVINAGRFDGILGLLLSIAAIEVLQTEGYTPKHYINVLGFCDEEGVRYHTTFLGSSFLCGTFDLEALDKVDEQGISMREALKARGYDAEKIEATKPIILPGDLFIEAHIEQGPALEALDLPLAVVSGIAAQTRLEVKVTGKAGHAGTTPPKLRQDALTAAAEMILEVEKTLKSEESLRATVGHIKISPNASNAIPGQAVFSIDLRYPNYDGLQTTKASLMKALKAIANQREVGIVIDCVQETGSSECDPFIQETMCHSLSKFQEGAPTLLSGAGHDTLKIAQTCHTGMMFIRCRDGLSHHPDEYTSPQDIRAALKAWVEIIRSLDQELDS
ncbi:M20 family metallo-hydrolase [Puniceicoccaceae bacterium K14]|nr:M20 family metallo-hydrolase [Puniceicoccaceae bacterium K14]